MMKWNLMNMLKIMWSFPITIGEPDPDWASYGQHLQGVEQSLAQSPSEQAQGDGPAWV